MKSLKILFLSLLTITTNTNYITSAKPTKKQFFNEICPKTKNPKQCLSILSGNKKTRSAATLSSLGEGCLDIAIAQAKSSVKLFNFSVKTSQAIPHMKKKYQYCLSSYNSAVKQLSEAKVMVAECKFVSARKSLEDSRKVPDACQKEVGAKFGAVRMANIMSDNAFDIAFVVVKELESKYRSLEEEDEENLQIFIV